MTVALFSKFEQLLDTPEGWDNFQRSLLWALEQTLNDIADEIASYDDELEDLRAERISVEKLKPTSKREARSLAVQKKIQGTETNRELAQEVRLDLARLLLACIPGRGDQFVEDIDWKCIGELFQRRTILNPRKRNGGRGRPPKQFEAARDKMRADIDGARLSPERLRCIPTKQLTHRYGVSRGTATHARDAVLNEYQFKKAS